MVPRVTWMVETCQCIVFSDESRVDLFSKWNIIVQQTKCKRFLPICCLLALTIQCNVNSLMEWRYSWTVYNCWLYEFNKIYEAAVGNYAFISESLTWGKFSLSTRQCHLPQGKNNIEFVHWPWCGSPAIASPFPDLNSTENLWERMAASFLTTSQEKKQNLSINSLISGSLLTKKVVMPKLTVYYTELKHARRPKMVLQNTDVYKRQPFDSAFGTWL